MTKFLICAIQLMVATSVWGAQFKVEVLDRDISAKDFYDESTLEYFRKNKRSEPELYPLGGRFSQPWVPKGHWLYSNDTECEPWQFSMEVKRKLNGSEPPRKVFSQTLNDYFNKCGKHLSRNSYWLPIFALMGSLGIVYDMPQNPRIFPVRITLKDGIVLKALLGLKRGEGKRPLVIIRQGLMSSRYSSTSNKLIMWYFDESPFNVLLIPSTTGYEFQDSNAIIALGGLDEGIQTFQVAKDLQSPEVWLSKYISSTHVIGLSLGGQASFFTSLFAGYNLKEDGNKYVNSVTSICPVVDLKASLDGLANGSLLGKLQLESVIQQFMSMLLRFPNLRDFVDDPDNPPSMKDIAKVIAKAVLPYYQKKIAGGEWLIPPLQTLNFKNVDEFWKAHRFQDYAEILNVPTYVIAARDDQIVYPNQNADVLYQNYKNIYSGKTDPIWMTYLSTKKGTHCQFESGYGWGFTGETFRSWILAHSPEFTVQERIVRVEITATDIPATFGLSRQYETFYGFDWTVLPGTQTARLRASYQYAHPDESKKREPIMIRKYREELADISLTKLGIPEEQFPVTPTEAESLTRWLNSNLRIWGKEVGKFNVTKESIGWITWSRYD